MLCQVKHGYVYIMASGRNGTLYIGATADLVKRAWEQITASMKLKRVTLPALLTCARP